jgi:hypothetical protein
VLIGLKFAFSTVYEAVDRGVFSDDDITQEKLEQFLSRSGRRFYNCLSWPREQRLYWREKRRSFRRVLKVRMGVLRLGTRGPVRRFGVCRGMGCR